MWDRRIVLLIVILISTAMQCSSLEESSPKSQSSVEHDYGLVYYSERKNSDGFIAGGFYVIDLETKEERYLTPDHTVSEYNGFSWCSETKHLAYTSGIEMNDQELYLVDMEGHNIRLTDNEVEDSNPICSPNGKLIAFNSNRRTGNLLYLMEIDSSEVESVFEGETMLGSNFAWSPNNKMSAISALPYLPGENPFAEELFVMDMPTKDIRLHLPNSHSHFNIDWSNDNTRLVYLSDYEVFQNIPLFKSIYVLDIHTSEVTKIVSFDSVSNPYWSPVSDVVAFSGGMFNEEEFNVYLVNGDGTGLQQLTDGGFYSVGSWSPDGKKLAISSIENNLPDSEIYILDVESGKLEQVTDNDTYEAFPIWIEF